MSMRRGRLVSHKFPVFAAAVAAFLLAAFGRAEAAQEVRTPDQQNFYDIYKELVEMNTTANSGDTVLAANAMAKHLIAAGYAKADVQVLENGSRKGNLVARLRGTGAKKPVLLLAHLDVVEAKREDWTTDPFKLVEKDGYFYARGSIDDKAMAASYVANLIRYKKEGLKPDRDIIVALTTDEEIADAGFDGAAWLVKNHRDLIDAEFVINEGGRGLLKDGVPYSFLIQTAEKIFVNYWLEVHNAGGHSSMPSRDNAIYRLAGGLARLQAFDFPASLNDTTREYFLRSSELEQGQVAVDMKNVASPAPDPAAIARLSEVLPYNVTLRTTCVATRLEGGHANNALPQLARALVNCRVMPGQGVDEVTATLTRVMADEAISVKPDFIDVTSAPSPLDSDVVRAAREIAQSMWPGVPAIPSMSAGATDTRFLRNAGIPGYGVSGLFMDRMENRIHGRDERVLIKQLFDSHEFLYRLTKQLAKP